VVEKEKGFHTEAARQLGRVAATERLLWFASWLLTAEKPQETQRRLRAPSSNFYFILFLEIPPPNDDNLLIWKVQNTQAI